MLTFSSQTLLLGNWITRKQLRPPLKCSFQKERVFILRADRKGILSRSYKIPPPPRHTHTDFKNGRKQRGRGDLIITIMIIKYIWILIEINEKNGASSHLPILRALLLHTDGKSKCGISFQKLILNQLYAERG